MLPRIACVAFCFLVLGGCAPIPASVPANVSTVDVAALPSPAAAAGSAAPRIVGARFNTLDVRRPQQWSGTIVTSTNVASVELKTNQFSLNIPRESFGVFRFRINVYDLPAEFIRRYSLRIIARNTAGDEAEEDVPFRVR
jgi:hypothetical protein